MKILTNPHFFSNLVLFFTTIIIIRKYFIKQAKYNGILLIIFASLIALRAVVDLMSTIFIDELQLAYGYILAASMIIAPICLVSAIWSIINHRPATLLQTVATIIFASIILAYVIYLKINYFGIIIQSFSILMVMITSIIGLVSRQKSALWIIVAMMFYALLIKSETLPIPMAPLDIEHYLLTLTILCIGKAVNSQFKYIF